MSSSNVDVPNADKAGSAFAETARPLASGAGALMEAKSERPSIDGTGGREAIA